MIDPKYIYIKELCSTNTYLKELVSNETVDEGTVVYTGTQTAGRGQRGNSWESEPDKNLTFSLFLRPSMVEAKNQFDISEIVSLSIISVLNNIKPGFIIKWPNDIYYNSKKIAGILIEHSLIGTNINYTIAGIGLNVNQARFVSDAPNPISLYNIIGHDIDREELLHQIIDEIMRQYDSINTDAEKRHALYCESLLGNKEKREYIDATTATHFYGTIINVVRDGTLLVLTDTGIIRKFAFKEIEFVL